MENVVGHLLLYYLQYVELHVAVHASSECINYSSCACMTTSRHKIMSHVLLSSCMYCMIVVEVSVTITTISEHNLSSYNSLG